MSPGFALGREEALDRLHGEEVDVFIIGGGINGAGIARDLMLRSSHGGWGLRVALADKGHFSGGTSGRNSQLIHGGLRYLENLEFGLVREALEERRTLLRIAPHLVEPLPMIIPFFGMSKRLYYGTGLAVYDFLAGKDNTGRRQALSRAAVAALEPDLTREGLHSAAVFYDCKVHSARLVLENLFDASRRGAVIANYVQVASWQPAEGGFEIVAEDVLSGRSWIVRAKRIVDARGPWEGGRNLRLVRGSHIIVPRLTRSGHAIAHFNDDGRILFVIPWGSNQDLSLVGTTDVDHPGTPDDVRISAEEVAYLQRAAKRLFPASAVDPVAAYASLRPLVAEPGKSASSTSRAHRIWLDQEGVLKISGGKYTTYRAMSEQAVALLFPESRQLPSTAGAPFEPSPPALPQEETVRRSVEQEMAVRLTDLLFTSTYWGHERRWTRDLLLPIASRMGELLRWEENRVEEEIARVLTIVRMPETAAR
ncbi:MAG: glycerol-3-phosphate dehydrogenase/oxidase [Acidobacteria bacterium]|nr:glycerol-3-phosphate dehydrogenase/oxidase [Acidobacteriota bacterium]